MKTREEASRRRAAAVYDADAATRDVLAKGSELAASRRGRRLRKDMVERRCDGADEVDDELETALDDIGSTG
jgi:hypothetical protein